MFEAAADGLMGLLDPFTLGLMVIGILIGLVVGLLPGLGGITAMVLMLPFTFDMTPIQAFSFLLF